jgi:hypothetical protein
MTTEPERWTQATEHPDVWVDAADDPRETGRQPVGERETLLDYLRAYRHTLRMKCEGLTAEQLALRSVPPSTMSLLGLVRHLAEVELLWTVRTMRGETLTRPWSSPEDRDADFDGAVADPAVVDEAWTAWRTEVAHAEQWYAGAPSLDVLGTLGDDEVELRDVLVHLVEEYARHCGHADLLRECIDGSTGL